MSDKPWKFFGYTAADAMEPFNNLRVGTAVRFLVVETVGKEERPITGSALDGAVFDFSQILAYSVHSMSRSQLCLGFGHFGWLSFFNQ